MKSKPFIITSLLCSGLLMSCGGPTEEKPPITDQEKPGGGETEKPGGEDKPEEPKEDFTVKTEGKGGSFLETSYCFTTINPEGEYFEFNDPVFSININQSNRQYVTGILENKVKILSETTACIPNDAVSYKTKVSTSSGLLEEIEIKIDRTKVKVGTTKLKFHFEPSNGVNTAEDIDLCVPVEIKEFGTIDPEIVKANIELDLTGLDSSAFKNELEFNIQDDDYEYGFTYKTVTSYKITETVTTLENVSIPLKQTLYFFARHNKVPSGFQSYALKIENDSSFTVNDNFYKFTSKPTETLKISLAN